VSEFPIFSAKKMIMLLEVDDSYLSVDGSLKDRSRRLSTAYCNGSESLHAVDGSSTIIFGTLIPTSVPTVPLYQNRGNVVRIGDVDDLMIASICLTYSPYEVLRPGSNLL
jgi:hypothetical protein